MIILIATALAAAQPAPAAPNTPPVQAQHQLMEHKGMGYMGMSKKQMAECHRCCEKMMAKMHHRHAQHRGHAA